MTDPETGVSPNRADGDAADVRAASRRHSSLVAAGIGLSRIAGLIRTRLFGHFFATGVVADAFTAAFRIPNLLQNLLGEGVLSASFIPVYSRLLAEGREEEAGRVAGAIAGLLTAVAGALVVTGIVFARPLATLVATGYEGVRFELTVDLMRIVFPGVGLLVLSAWCLGVLNSHRRFFLSYVAPVIWNAVQIAVLAGLGFTVFADELIAGGGDLGAEISLVTWLAWATAAGGLAQFLVQLPAVISITRGLRPSLSTRLAGVRDAIRAFWPIVAGRGVVQVSAYVDLFLASFLATGAVAALSQYAQLLYFLPISLFGMSVAAAELPELSATPDPDEHRALGVVVDRLEDGLERIAVFVVPTMVGYLVVGDFVVGAIFQSGEFGRLETLQVWAVLGGYAVGLLASTSSRLLQSALYGIGDTATPARIAAVRVVVSALLGVALMFQLDRVGVTAQGLAVSGDLPASGPLPAPLQAASEQLERLGAMGLSLAAGLAAWLEYYLLARAVGNRFGIVRLGGDQLSRVLVAAGAAGAVGFGLRFPLSGLGTIPAGIVMVVAVAGVYVTVAHRIGITEIADLVDHLRPSG